MVEWQQASAYEASARITHRTLKDLTIYAISTVVLDVKPVFTTLIVLIGWAMKTFVAHTLHPWLNKGGSNGEVFLAYSIP